MLFFFILGLSHKIKTLSADNAYDWLRIAVWNLGTGESETNGDILG